MTLYPTGTDWSITLTPDELLGLLAWSRLADQVDQLILPGEALTHAERESVLLGASL